jgi:hypothetical protein
VFQAPDAFLEAIYPSPLNAERYIRLVAPTSYQGMFFYNPLKYNASNFDYMIIDGTMPNPEAGAEKKTRIAAGLFDYNWQIDTNYLEKGDPNTRANCSRLTVNRDLKIEIATPETNP